MNIFPGWGLSSLRLYPRALPFAVLLSSLFLAGCGSSDKAPEAAAVSSDSLQLEEETIVNLELDFFTAAPLQLRETIRIQGEIGLDMRQTASVPARVEGIISEFAADVGDQVASGDDLAVLSSRELSDRIMEYVKTERHLEFGRQAFDREKELLQKEISSEEQFQEVRQRYLVAQNDHSVALQRLRLLGYSEEQLHQYLDTPDRKDMTHYSVTAPLDGEVLERNLQTGAAVKPMDALFRVADLGSLWVHFSIPLAYLDGIREGDIVNIRNEALDREGDAEILLIEKLARRETRTVPARARLDNSSGDWHPGIPISVEIDNVPASVETAIPLSAVHTLGERTIAFLVDADQSIRPVTIRTGRSDQSHVEILQGLQPGDEVLAENSFLILAEWESQQMQ